MVLTNGTAVPAWAWTTSTVVTAVSTLALVVILGLHVYLTAVPPSSGRRPVRGEDRLRRRLWHIAIPLGVLLAVAVVVRFGFIVTERPGP